MKTVYFVRHGQAEVNVSDTFGAEDTPLTDKGREQARALAERCSKLPVDCVVASTMARAQETASIVLKQLDISLMSSALFEERHRPQSLYGKRRDDPDALRKHLEWCDGFFEEGIRVEDGDNFVDLKERAGKILSFLEQRTESNILVVMHGFMLRTILARTIFGEELTPHDLFKVVRTFHIMQTGISVVTFAPEEAIDRPYPRGPWRIITWNDQAHLGDV